MDLLDVAHDVAQGLDAEGRLVRLATGPRTVFVGDIHGDLDAVERVFSDVQLPGTVLVFLGDAVDRGPASRECLERILREKLEHPRSVHLLMGNHEAWGAAKFHPADFWESLSPEEAAALAPDLLRLPLAAWHPSGLLALHGALPCLARLSEISTVAVGSSAWRDITWGDWSDHLHPLQRVASRPIYGPREFSTRSSLLGVSLLVRSHQPDAPSYLFDDRCLTLFTSRAYGGQRRVAVLLPDKSIATARDLTLVEI
jgi:protein phosphatase